MIYSQHYPSLTIKEKRLLREKYVDDQKGLCYHCGQTLCEVPTGDFTKKWINWRMFPGGKDGFLKYPVHLHHDHDTGMTIGAVHAFCNAYMWQYLGE